MARTNKSQYAILGCLALRSMSAYEIKRFIQQSIANFWAEGEGRLYPTLNFLAERKFVSYKEIAAEKSGTKKIYSITKMGASALAEWLKSSVEKTPYRNELLLKMFFGSLQSEENNIALLNEAIQQAEKDLQLLQMLQKTLMKKEIPELRKLYGTMTLDYGLHILTAEIKWCRTWVEKLTKENQKK